MVRTLFEVSLTSAFMANAANPPQGLRVLFLGDHGHHRPADRFKQLQPVLAQRNIELEYTDSLADLNPAKLAGYDGLLIYANHTRIAPDQEMAVLDFVAAGGGLVPLHCASYCFLNSPKYIELVGAQFQKHGTGVFKETIINTEHAVTKGLSAIESWDETYVHTKHNADRVVLAERRDGPAAEPWTWVREHGRGRVFYTAWGHDQRTWSNPGFQALVENGLRWATENSPTRLRPRAGLKPFEYAESSAPLPNYTPGAQWGTQGEPIRTMQKPLDPAESMKHLVTFPEFDVSLFASEPDVIKPIWLAWDERGRLWIAETVDYPNELQPEGQGRDRLKICEDTDGDGRADKFTVFVEKLSIPTGFVFANGGVIVIHSGRTEFFKDTNGDDKADERRVLFGGWGMRDTHATASNLRYGFDNWIWGTVGYSGFNGTVGGKPLRFGQGIFRFKPDGSALEFVRSSNNNTWGLGLTEDNLIFGSTANGNASMYMPIPNRYYEAVNGWSASRLETIADSQRFYPLTATVRQVDYHGRYTAGSGSAIYTARNLPKAYWNRVQFVSEPTGHLVGWFHLEARGADFIAHNARNFAASDDEWTSPIYAEVGPDGALWVVDWYNYVIQHNPTPRGFRTGKGAAYETPLRDKAHGRIYRIAHNGQARSQEDERRSPSPRPSPAGRGSNDSSAGISPSVSAHQASSDAPSLSQRERAGVREKASSGDRAASNQHPPAHDHRVLFKLHNATPQQLVAALKNDNMLWRMHAQRLLVERGQRDVVPALCELIRDPNVDEIGLNPTAIHALWTLQGLGVFGTSGEKATTHNPATGTTTTIEASRDMDATAVAAVLFALKHPSAGVRRAAVMVLPRNEASAQVLLTKKMLEDANSQVRLASLLALAEMPPTDAAGNAVFALLQKPENAEDRWIPDAVTAAAARNDAAFIKAVLGNYKPASAQAAPEAPANLIQNPSFEEQSGGRPSGWRTVTHSGRGDFSSADLGRMGNRSVMISSEQGGDLSWSAQVPVRPRTEYRLTGWIKTQGVGKIGGAHGAMFNIHELQDPIRGATKALVGDNDWTLVQLNFNSGEMRQVTINCLFGGWGRAAGTAWFDDVELTMAPGSELAGEVGRVIRLVTAHYAQRGPMESIVPTLVSLRGASSGLAVPILDGLVSGWPRDTAPVIGEHEKQTLTELMQTLPESVRDRLLALSQRWGRSEIFGSSIAAIIESLRKQIATPEAAEDRRAAAAKRLVGLDSQPETLEFVIEQVSLLTPPSLGTGLVNALAESRGAEAGRVLISGWPRFTPTVRRAATSALMRRPEWTRALLDAVQNGAIGRTDLAVEHWAQLKQNPNPIIARRAERLAAPVGGISAEREEVVKKLLPLAREKGDSARGREVYAANCAVCHTFDGQGGKVGPELTGISVRDRTDILLEILDPNRSVEANYRLWNVTSKDGETLSGRLEVETQTTVELLDTTAQKHIIQRKDIATMSGSQLSIMPTGFEALPSDDLKALLEYLCQARQ
ncbi:MAG: ThuA domain-containing protein [Verrucomicrobia bacterium]|nr:ThuA domain-containing protein [Verrucomicrobiota bacterium]